MGGRTPTAPAADSQQPAAAKRASAHCVAAPQWPGPALAAGLVLTLGARLARLARLASLATAVPAHPGPARPRRPIPAAAHPSIFASCCRSLAHSGRSYRTIACAPVARSPERQYDLRWMLLARFSKSSRKLLLVDHPQQPPAVCPRVAHRPPARTSPSLPSSTRRDSCYFIFMACRPAPSHNIILTRGAAPQFISCRSSAASRQP